MTYKPTLDTPLEKIFFDARALNCLKNDRHNTLGDIIGLTDDYLLKIPNLGKRTLRRIRDTLAKIAINPDVEDCGDVRAELARVAAELRAEKNYTNKLRDILSRLTGDRTLAELRAVGITVDLRVRREDVS